MAGDWLYPFLLQVISAKNQTVTIEIRSHIVDLIFVFFVVVFWMETITLLTTSWKNFRHYKILKRHFDSFILMSCKQASGYFMTGGQEIALTLCTYLDFLWSCFVKDFFAHGPIEQELILNNCV